MVGYDVRFPKETLEHLKWYAASLGIESPEALRRIVWDVVKDARPPARIHERVIAASDAQWQAWRDAAATLGMSLDDLLKNTMDGIVKKVFAPR